MTRPPLVLLVTTDRQTRRMVSDCLAMFGHEVLTAASSDEALTLLQDGRRVRVLVTDVELPGATDGLALAKFARDRDPAISVIYTSVLPHQVPAARKVTGAPTLRTPYVSQQLVGVIAGLRQTAGLPARQAA